MLVKLGDDWNGVVCFAGTEIDTGLATYIRKLDMQNRVVSVVKPSHQNVLVLYSACEAFIFPSFSEGFGWPVIEAQACGAAVIASDIEPMPEVSGGAAIHKSPYDSSGFAKALLSLKDQTLKDQLIARGYENSTRFFLNTMIDSYLALYNGSENS